jgi:FkbM family methyltransferase
MIKSRLRNAAKRALLAAELERRRPAPVTSSRPTMAGCLEIALRNGISPRTVIDVGAANGTPDLYAAFPNAHHVMMEPLAEFGPALNQLIKSMRSAQVIMGVASSEAGEAILHVHPDLVGSSLLLEPEESDVNGVERKVPAFRLDDLVTEHKLTAPFVLKLDTQGSELAVLEGARDLLPSCDLILMEVSCFAFFEGGPLMHDSIQYLLERGFCVYDIYDIQYRPLDGALSQADIAFVRTDGPLRAQQFYATPEQRSEQNARLRPIK